MLQMAQRLVEPFTKRLWLAESVKTKSFSLTAMNSGAANVMVPTGFLCKSPDS